MFTRAWWRDAAERAISTFAQAAIATFGTLPITDAFAGNRINLTLLQTFATTALSAGIAAVLSLLKSMAAAKLVDDTVSPASLASEPVLTRAEKAAAKKRAAGDA